MMRLTTLDYSTDGGGSGPNEDLAGQRDMLAWIIDGATPVEAPVMDDTSDARWLAFYLDSLLRSSIPVAKEHVSLRQIFLELRDAVRTEMGDRLLPDHVDPVCSLALARLEGPYLNVGVLGDVSVITKTDNGIQVATNFGFGRREATAAAGLAHDQESSEQQRLRTGGVAERRRQYIDGVNGLQVFSPRMGDEATITSFQWKLHRSQRILFVSDGLTRLFDSYGIFESPDEFYDAITSNGVRAGIELLRSHERGVRTNLQHFKSADDATGMLVCVNPGTH